MVTLQLVAANSVAVANHFLEVSSPSRVRLAPQVSLEKYFSWGFFDGVAQGDPSMCGVGAVLYLEEGHFFHARWGLGEGTNNKAELMALYMLLLLAFEKGIQRLQVFGDSSVTINWINQTLQCHNILLIPILEEAIQLKSIFNSISFAHIYREQNQEANTASKEAVGIYQHGWELEEFGTDGSYSFYHRPYIDTLT